MISIDFETFSEVSIYDTGLYPYAYHASTEALILAYTFNEGKAIGVWTQEDPPPKELFEHIAMGEQIRAFNADFEREIWENVCVKKLGWPPIPIEQWLDTQALTYSLALPGSLEKVAMALGLEVQKNPEGKRLIHKFSKPRKPTKRNPSTRIYPRDEPEEFEKFVTYCIDDVRVECEVYATIPLKQIPKSEVPIVAQHVRMNRAGIALDIKGFTAISRMLEQRHEKLLKEFVELTDGRLETTGQRDKFLAWAKDLGYPLPGFTKFDLNQALEDPDLCDEIRRAIEIRLELGQVSVKKYSKMKHVICDDGYARGNLIYHRATTGRSGGAGLQLHNFPRDYVAKDPKLVDECIAFIEKEQYEYVDMLYGNLVDVAKGLLRPMVQAPEGKLLYVADFSGVENRGTAWIARDPVGLQVFQDRRDQYVEFASTQFHIPPEKVSDEQRTAAKATILGAIFGAGWKTIHATNEQRGIPMTEQEAQRNVDDFRRIYHVTAKTWYALAKNALLAVKYGTDRYYKGLKFGVRKDFLFIRLPSGRLLAYYKPQSGMVKTPWGQMKEAVTYMGSTAQLQWIRLTLTPNRLIENIVSAICRDLLMHSMLVIERDRRVTPVLSVHDEAVSYGEPDALTLDEYTGLMATLPDWAINDQGIAFPLEAEGYIAKRYKK